MNNFGVPQTAPIQMILFPYRRRAGWLCRLFSMGCVRRTPPRRAYLWRRSGRKCGGEKISCLSHTAFRGRQRTDSTAGGTDSDTLPHTDGRPDGFAVFFYAGLGLCGLLTSDACSRDSRTVRGQEVSACLTQLSGVARELPPPQVAPENCFHRRWLYRFLSTKSLDGCIIMLSAAGGSRLLIPNKGVSRHEVFHLPRCI